MKRKVAFIKSYTTCLSKFGGRLRGSRLRDPMTPRRRRRCAIAARMARGLKLPFPVRKRKS